MIRRFLAALAVLAALVTASPSPVAAQAAPPAAVARVQAAAWSDCANYPGTVCLTAHANWGDPVWRQYPWQINGCTALHGFNDITTMAVNNSDDYSVTLYEHGSCTGVRVLITSGQAMDFSGTVRNDLYSGIKVTWHG
jgi:hypothetical protein